VYLLIYLSLNTNGKTWPPSLLFFLIFLMEKTMSQKVSRRVHQVYESLHQTRISKWNPSLCITLMKQPKKKKENVTLSINKGILVSYVHFPSKYFLESSFSVGVTYTIKPPPPTVDTMSLIIGLCVSIAVVLVLCLAGCVYLRRGSKSGYTGV